MDQVRAALISIVVALLVGCDRPSAEQAGGRSAIERWDSAPARAVGVVDSIHSPEEALRRFHVGLANPGVLDGPVSRDTLIHRFFEAVRRRDLVRLNELAVNRAEYAYLVFPQLDVSRPPYRQPPEVAWLLLEAARGSGMAKLVNQAANRFELLAYDCPSAARAEGAVRVQAGCVVRVREGGRERNIRLFGKLVEVGGRWKFLAYDSDL